MSVISDTRNALKSFSDWLERSPWRNEASAVDVWIKELETPCVIAVSGMVKAGKSSFINALLGEDLTVVGDLETTATINMVRYAGVKRSSNQAVKCIWKDGRNEWRGRDFIHALQGKDPVTLQTAAEIDHLEFFVDNPLLSQVSVIDTPGYGAYTGEDGNAHERTLREWHTKQTKDLTVGADAVIFLLDSAISNFTDTDVDFLTGAEQKAIFSQDRAIFLLSKADMLDEDVRTKKSAALQKDLGDRVSDLRGSVFMPVSAEIQRFLNAYDEDGLEQLRVDVKGCISNANDVKLQVERIFPVSTDALRTFKNRYDWGVVRVVAKELVVAKDFEDARKRLEGISGFTLLRKELDRIFFERTAVLRCTKIINAALELIYRLQDYECGRYQAHKESFSRCLRDLQAAVSGLRKENDEAAEYLDRVLTFEEEKYTYDPEILRRELDDYEREVERLRDDESELHLLNLMFRVREIYEANRQKFQALSSQIGQDIGFFDAVYNIASNFEVFTSCSNANAEEQAQAWEYYNDVAADGDFKAFAAAATELYRTLSKRGSKGGGI